MSQPIIELENIVFAYDPEADKRAIDGVSLTVEQGEWLAIIGHNGSGKSTIAKIMNGLLEPTAGQVKVDGEVLTEETLWSIRKKIGMVFQNPDNQFVGATVEDDVAFTLENQGVPREEMVKRVQDALERVRMDAFKTREPARLSGGQKQRVAIAGVIASRPKVIILDESTSMLDPEGRREVIATIEALKRETNLTVISITHDIDEAANADRILVLNQGKVVEEGTPKTIFSLGERLIRLGLDLPFSEKLKTALRAEGIEPPTDYLTEEGLKHWLWTSGLKK